MTTSSCKRCWEVQSLAGQSCAHLIASSIIAKGNGYCVPTDQVCYVNLAPESGCNEYMSE